MENQKQNKKYFLFQLLSPNFITFKTNTDLIKDCFGRLFKRKTQFKPKITSCLNVCSQEKSKIE